MRLKKSLLPLFTIGALFALVSQAHAMCVYNDMDVEISVEFICGSFCENDWLLSPGGYACRPDKGGHIDRYANCVIDPCPLIFRLEVEAHGYVVYYGTGGRGSTRQVCSYRADDTLAAPCINFVFP